MQKTSPGWGGVATASLKAAGQIHLCRLSPAALTGSPSPRLWWQSRDKAGCPQGQGLGAPLLGDPGPEAHPSAWRSEVSSKKPFPRQPQGHPREWPTQRVQQEGWRRPLGLAWVREASCLLRPHQSHGKGAWGLSWRAADPIRLRLPAWYLCHPRQPSQNEPLTIMSCPPGTPDLNFLCLRPCDHALLSLRDPLEYKMPLKHLPR